MSLLIKGMDMPKDNQQHDINLFNTADGFWAYEYRFENSESKYKTRLLYSVAEVPTPHGRLIDADRLIVALKNSVYANSFFCTPTLIMSQIEQLIEHQPIIIDAEE